MGSHSRKTASIFIIVLWVLCLLSVFAVTLSQIVRQKISLASKLQRKEKLRYIAEAGVMKAISAVKGNDTKTCYAFMDTWANDPSQFSDIGVGDGFFNVSYEYPDDISQSIVIKYGLIDEERKININRADNLTLKRLFAIVLGMEEAQAKDLASAFINWRSSDASSMSEDNYYLGLPHSYKAKHADFEAPDEILLVRGINQNAWQKLKNYITIYGDGKVNVNTAGRPVLLALGLDENTANMVIAYRAGDDKVLGTLDDRVFDAASNIVTLLSASFKLSPQQLTTLNDAVKNMSTVSSYFTAISNAGFKDTKDALSTISVVDKQAHILYWQEN